MRSSTAGQYMELNQVGIVTKEVVWTLKTRLDHKLIWRLGLIIKCVPSKVMLAIWMRPDVVQELSRCVEVESCNKLSNLKWSRWRGPRDSHLFATVKSWPRNNYIRTGTQIQANNLLLKAHHLELTPSHEGCIGSSLENPKMYPHRVKDAHLPKQIDQTTTWILNKLRG